LSHANYVAPFTMFLDNFEITYSDGKITETHAGMNGTIWKEFLIHTSGNSNIMQVTMVNAWDAGFFFVHLVEDQSVNIVPATAPDNIGRTLYSQSSFYHVGQHQKNNISPYDAKGCITLGDVDSPTKLLFYLWRKNHNQSRSNRIWFMK
jgi:hypothetical protein